MPWCGLGRVRVAAYAYWMAAYVFIGAPAKIVRCTPFFRVSYNVMADASHLSVAVHTTRAAVHVTLSQCWCRREAPPRDVLLLFLQSAEAA